MSIYIIDYGMGNLFSVTRAFEKCGAKVEIAKSPAELSQATHIVLPGVGSFHDGMEKLREGEWVEAIRHYSSVGIPVLGICLGMQLLADYGMEGGRIEGLALIPGAVDKLIPQSEDERIPHVGWNDIVMVKSDDLMSNIQSGTDFYFVHSYHFIPVIEEHILSKTKYCGEFVSSISKDSIYGVQFHPEKSGVSGFQLIKNFIAL